MPTVLVLGPYRFFFFSYEGIEPPHIHVEGGSKYAKFWLQPNALAVSYDYNSHELHEVREIIAEIRLQFLRRWHEHFGR
jgi:hypothetical protein